jgi:hypothetical protein
LSSVASDFAAVHDVRKRHRLFISEHVALTLGSE